MKLILLLNVAVSWKKCQGFYSGHKILSWRRVWEQLSPFSRTSEFFKCPNRIWAPKIFKWISMTVGICLYILGRAVHPVVAQSQVVSNSLWPHELQHTRPPCPSLPPGVCSNSCPLSQWWHSAISSSVTPFSSCPQSFPASGSFQMSQLFASGGQSIGASASNELEGISPSNEYSGIWFPLGLTGLISLQSKGLSSPASQFKSISSLSLGFLWLAVNTNFGHLQGSPDSTQPQIKCLVFLFNLYILHGPFVMWGNAISPEAQTRSLDFIIISPPPIWLYEAKHQLCL